MSLFIQKRKDVVLPAGIYQGRVSRIRSTRDGESIMIIVSVDTPGYQGVEVTGFCKANWNPPTGRTTANLRQWVMNLGVEVIDGQESSIDLECLKGRPCSIVVNQYQSMAGETRCKIMNMFPLNSPVPNPVPAPAPVKQGVFVGKPAVKPAPVQAAHEVPPTPAVQPIAINTAAQAPVSTVAAPSPIGVGTATPPQMPNAVTYAQPAPQQPVAAPVQEQQVSGPSEDGFKW